MKVRWVTSLKEGAVHLRDHDAAILIDGGSVYILVSNEKFLGKIKEKIEGNSAGGYQGYPLFRVAAQTPHLLKQLEKIAV